MSTRKQHMPRTANRERRRRMTEPCIEFMIADKTRDFCEYLTEIEPLLAHPKRAASKNLRAALMALVEA